MPLVTVIMPAYNAARTIERAIESVRSQEFEDWRMVVIDDGSTDETKELAQRSTEIDRRIEVLVNDSNIGAAASMNRAWRSSDSKYVAILDSDDVALPHRLSYPVRFLDERGDISAVGGAAHFVDAKDNLIRTVFPPTHHDELWKNRWYCSPFIHPTVTMRRKFLTLLEGYCETLRLGEDYDLWMRGFVQPSVTYANLQECLVRYTSRSVQRWQMIRASAFVRIRAGKRERRQLRSAFAAMRILGEGAIEQTGFFRLLRQTGAKLPGATVRSPRKTDPL